MSAECYTSSSQSVNCFIGMGSKKLNDYLYLQVG